ELVVICPKMGELTSLTGGLNCEWFQRLKNSARNCKLASSRSPPTVVFLMIAKSQLFCEQQLMIPTPELPKPVPQPTNPASGQGRPLAGSVAPPNSGNDVNAAGLTKPPILDFVLPGVLRGIPDLQLPRELQFTGSASSARA